MCGIYCVPALYSTLKLEIFPITLEADHNLGARAKQAWRAPTMAAQRRSTGALALALGGTQVRTYHCSQVVRSPCGPAIVSRLPSLSGIHTAGQLRARANGTSPSHPSPSMAGGKYRSSAKYTRATPPSTIARQ